MCARRGGRAGRGGDRGEAGGRGWGRAGRRLEAGVCVCWEVCLCHRLGCLWESKARQGEAAGWVRKR